MKPYDIIIMSVVLIGVVCFFIALFFGNFPVAERAMFEGICNRYMKVIVAEGDLTSNEVSELKLKLQSRNYDNVTVSVLNGDWGDKGGLNVTCTYSLNYLGQEHSYTFGYENYSLINGMR